MSSISSVLQQAHLAVKLDRQGERKAAALLYLSVSDRLLKNPTISEQLRQKALTYRQRAQQLRYPMMQEKQNVWPKEGIQAMHAAREAVAMDLDGKLDSAFQCYLRTAEFLFKARASPLVDPQLRRIFTQRLKQYLGRAEILKMRLSAACVVGGELALVDAGAGPKCTVCLDREINTVFLDCGHSAVCWECGLHLGKTSSNDGTFQIGDLELKNLPCIICRVESTRLKRIFIAGVPDL